MISKLRMLIALPIFLIAAGLNLLSVYIGGEKFAEIYIEALKKRVREL